MLGPPVVESLLLVSTCVAEPVVSALLPPLVVDELLDPDSSLAVVPVLMPAPLVELPSAGATSA